MYGRALIRYVILAAFVVFGVAAGLAQDIEDAQAVWDRLGVEAYHITIQDASVWGILTLDLWVQNEMVRAVDATCSPGLIGTPCSLGRVDVSQYTVERLFALADASGERLVSAEYDPVYHYPILLAFDNPQALDDERTVRVTRFDTIPAGDLSANSITTPTIPADNSWNPITPDGEVGAWLDDAEQHWNALDFNSYQLTALVMTPWDGATVTLDVLDGNPSRMQVTCKPGWLSGPCAVFAIDTERYTIPALLALLREATLVNDDTLQWLAVDADTGIPLRIIFDDPALQDEEWEIIVLRVVPLRPASSF